MKKTSLKKIKNLITFDRALQIPQTIVSIAAIVGGIFGIALILFRAVRKFVWALLKNVYQLEAWSIPIVPKLWQVLFLLIGIIIAYFCLQKVSRNHKLKKSLIEFQNFNWRIAKDIFNRYHIDSFPYCIKHNKQIIWTEDTTRYCRCPDCDNPYSFEDIQKIYPEIQKYVMKKYNLFYEPDINYICFDFDRLNKKIERIENKIDKI